MKTRNFKVQPLLGIDERVPQDPMACTEIVNFTVDDNGAWSSCIGYEKFFPAKTTYEPFELYPAFDSLYVWSTHSGARTYYLCESNGSLFFVNVLVPQFGGHANCRGRGSSRSRCHAGRLTWKSPNTRKHKVCISQHSNR